MHENLDIVAFVGSLRQGSFTRRLVESLKGVTPQSMTIATHEIGDLPFYNEDLADTPPASWVGLRDRIRRADGVLFATPEYNRSMPGVLKNAIDIASRPYGQSAWTGKPAAVLSCSPGAIGGFGANHHLRQCLCYLDMPTLAQPEAYIGQVDKLVNEQHQFTSDDTRAFLATFLEAFETWILRLRHGALQLADSEAPTG